MTKIKPQFVTDEKGKKNAVIIPVEEYNELLEDLHDLGIIAERREEAATSFNEVKKKLRNDGFL
jgi:PHD/YefM family antitoxin component YafN of YafNO toxin-antitoxin module